ncbi:MAG: OmpA family protein [Algoriphagus sp.]|uniref:OmpA family protein n=1 Tax=Algoriphagus sp. TaxID=1872435 RepID=UPI00262C5549|nr:OmpA family protein [Algoriphagus sp.]MDG1277760.1 OmpA family protein [Algoriphagus sp.]
MKTINKLVIGVMLTAISFGSISCGSTSNAVKGGVIGGAAGGALGGVMAGGENTALGVILGSAIGGSAGAIIGKQMDRQAEELKKLENAEVERVGEGIKITFDSGLMFPFDQYALIEQSRTNLRELAESLKEHPDTNILIEGHTDNTGKEAYNMKLSKRRAESVKDYLTSLGVDSNRLEVTAFGEEMPIASNDTEEGRQKNRRVEVAISANEKMQNDAIKKVN